MERPTPRYRVEGWDDLLDMLQASHIYLEAAVAPPSDADGDEWTAAAHATRLLGYVTDAMLLAAWIQSVVQAHDARPGGDDDDDD